MQLLFLLLLYNIPVSAFYNLRNLLSWTSVSSESQEHTDNGLYGGYQRSVSATGRVFVTLLGYPAKCEQKGVSHSCTLSLACWFIGGLSQSGCGGNPWLIACCITSKAAKNHKKTSTESHEDYQKLDFEGESPFMLQRRNDEVEDECGLSADRIILKRVIGGKQARFAQFPWQAHLRISSYQCGGVLVSRNFVATAAHCIVRARLKDIMVYLGELDTQDTGKVLELAPAELHRVKRKIIHPDFKYRITQPDRYDLALLELVTEAGYSFHILPICLPQPYMVVEGRNAMVAGWGKIKPSTELTGTNILRSATLPILNIKECMSWHKRKHISVQLYDEMICAGHEDGHQDACLGDSGGPLIVLENERWTLVGITSAGFGCGETHQPGIYHSVPVTVDWIKSIVYS